MGDRRHGHILTAVEKKYHDAKKYLRPSDDDILTAQSEDYNIPYYVMDKDNIYTIPPGTTLKDFKTKIVAYSRHGPGGTATQAKTCKDAAQAYHLAVRGPSVPAISRSVVVIKVGNSRYVVMDPGELQGEFEVTVIFDSTFKPLASFKLLNCSATRLSKRRGIQVHPACIPFVVSALSPGFHKLTEKTASSAPRPSGMPSVLRAGVTAFGVARE